MIHHMSFRFLLFLCASLFSFLASALAENPHWIWHDNSGGQIQPDEVRYFRKGFHLATLPTRADLSIACDDEAVIYLNGKQVAQTKDYNKPAYENVTSKLHKGENVIAEVGEALVGQQGVDGRLSARLAARPIGHQAA